MSFVHPPAPTRLAADDYLSVEGITLAAVAVVLTAAAIVAANMALLLLAGVSLAAAVLVTLGTSAKALMAPTQDAPTHAQAG